MTEHIEMLAAMEAILFVTSEPVPREKLVEIFGERSAEAAGKAVDEIVERYGEGEGRGVVLEEVAGGLRLITRPELNGYLRKFFEATGRTKLSMAALETLAIVAYRQPISGPEIQELRGVASGGVLRTLLERRLVRVAGRKPVVGKPFLYRTTRDFLTHFGLEAISDLPPLEEFEERFGALGDIPEQMDMESGEDVVAMEAELAAEGVEGSEDTLAEGDADGGAANENAPDSPSDTEDPSGTEDTSDSEEQRGDDD